MKKPHEEIKMHGVIWLSLLMWTSGSSIAQQPAAETVKTGTIQGVVTRVGTSDPIPDVQVTVSTTGRVNPTITGPAGQPITLTPALAQLLLDSVANGNSNVIGMPREYVEIAESVIRESQNGGATPAAGPPTSKTAVTGKDGQFVITGMPTGQVTVKIQSEGYFAPPVNGFYGPTVTATAAVTSDAPAKLQLSMVLGGTFSGRVTDESGRPLADISVQALTRSYTNGHLTLSQASAKQTDDRGIYRLYRLPPGEYFIGANPRRQVISAVNESANNVPLFTLFPSAEEPSVAVPIALRGGDDVSGYDIRVKTAPSSKISGKVASTLPPGPVTNLQGQARPANPSLFIARRDELGLSLPDIFNSETITATANGSFQFRNVTPGSYEIFAQIPIAANTGWGTANPPARAGSPWALGRASVDVRAGEDINDVVVTVHQGSNLLGHIFVDGRPAAAALRIGIGPDDIASTVQSGAASGIYSQIIQYAPAVQSDASFIFPFLPEGRYRFLIAAGIDSEANAQPGGRARPAGSLVDLPVSAYVADIRQHGESVFDGGLVVTAQGVDTVDILFKTDGSSIEGVVTGPDQKPMSGVTVVLAPPESRQQNPALFKNIRTDNRGHFLLNTVPPGTYTLFAWENPPAGSWLDPEFLGRYAARGVRVTVIAGAKSDIALEVLR